MGAEKNFREVFAKRLNYYMSINGKKQIDLVEDLGFSRPAVSTWCNAKKMPEMVKIDLLAKYFNINRSDLLEDKKEEKNRVGFLLYELICVLIKVILLLLIFFALTLTLQQLYP